MLESAQLWAPLPENFLAGLKTWGEKPETISETMPGKEGRFQLKRVRGGNVKALLSIRSDTSAAEKLISLNHEILHFRSARTSALHIANGNEIKGCLSQYRLDLLKDETEAYRQEIEFWKNAPTWFREKLAGPVFESKLLRGRYNYTQYYETLEAQLERDPNFILRRYIDLGEYPQCAKALLKL